MPERNVTVTLYGSLARLAGARERRVSVSGDSPTVGDLRAVIARDIPEVASHLGHTAVAMGPELFDDDALLQADCEISLLPPVSGGER